MAKVYETLEELLKDFPKRELGRANNLTDKEINNCRFICRVKTEENRIAYWALKCLHCGKYFVVRAYSVLQGYTTSCGCVGEKTRYITDHSKNLSGLTFGALTVKCRMGRQGKDASWLCECECGKTRIVSTTYLKNSPYPRCVECAHQYSSYEKVIENWLIENSFQFNKQYQTKELGKQRFDFQVFLPDGGFALIEMQGQQHYIPIECWGGEEKFKTQVKHDKEKEDYCKKYNIPLLIIKFDENIKDKLANFFSTFND